MNTRRTFLQSLSAVAAAFALPWGKQAKAEPTPTPNPVFKGGHIEMPRTTVTSLVVTGGTVRISGKVVDLKAFPGATIIIESDSMVENLTSIGGSGPIFQAPRR